ncbi:MAG: hypothetical protein WBL50_21100 [Candidatus Acidiferrum sp.]
MPFISEALSPRYVQAWIGVAFVLLYYLVLFLVFRVKPRNPILIPQYRPPLGISPALAAALVENGSYERAFVAALVSLSRKGILELGQNADRFDLKRLREPQDSLPPEESVILTSLFIAIPRYSFDSVEYERLCTTYAGFIDVLDPIVRPEFISAHLPFWWIGVAFSLLAAIPVAISTVAMENHPLLASYAFFAIWILLGASCLNAGLRVWPATFHKLTSFIPWDDRPSRPLDINDAIPIFLAGSACAAFMFLAVLTSTVFALFLAVLLLINFIFRHALSAPTRKGSSVLAELRNFREFLARTDSGRLNQDNQPGQTPRTLDEFSAYAVALKVEHAWGEEFVQNLLTLLEYHQAYNIPLPRSHSAPILLRLTAPSKRRRKKSPPGRAQSHPTHPGSRRALESLRILVSFVRA